MLHEKGADINAIHLLTWQTIHGRNAATGSTTQQDFLGSWKYFSIKEKSDDNGVCSKAYPFIPCQPESRSAVNRATHFMLVKLRRPS